MKRIIVVPLALLLLFVLAGCSGGSNQIASDGSKSEASVAEEAATEEAVSDDGTLSFDNAVILDNDVATIEVVQFYEEEYYSPDDEAPETGKCFTVKVHNNTDREFLFNFEDAYIDDEGVSIAIKTSNHGPAAGKSRTYDYIVQRESGGEYTQLESLDDLYRLEGTIRTNLFIDDEYLEGDEEASFSFAGLRD